MAVSEMDKAMNGGASSPPIMRSVFAAAVLVAIETT